MNKKELKELQGCIIAFTVEGLTRVKNKEATAEEVIYLLSVVYSLWAKDLFDSVEGISDDALSKFEKITMKLSDGDLYMGSEDDYYESKPIGKH